MVFDEEGISLKDWKTALDSGEKASKADFIVKNKSPESSQQHFC